MWHNCHMSLVDTLYDVISGIGGTLFGIAVTTLINLRRNRRMSDMLATNQKKIDALGAENERLIGVVREKENLILEMENRILATKKQKKRRK